MSAIAFVLKARGETVSGSDRQESATTQRLRNAGIEVRIGHDAAAVSGAGVVVYTPAISPDNPELVEARRLGIPTMERPQMLGRLMKDYRYRVAVSGAHGKTTTTSMIAAILDHAGKDPTIFVGGDVASLGGNARLGHSQVVVAEACEAFGSFLHLQPSIAVITNVDADHLDYYGTIEKVEEAFERFVANTDRDGCVVACWDDARARRIAEQSERRTVSFGIDTDSDFKAESLDLTGPRAEYSLVVRGTPAGRVRLGVPGRHNVLNSLAASAAADELDVPVEETKAALESFRGAGRRFEILYDSGGLTVVDDYAHHPAEIVSTITAARDGFRRRIIAIFQPHLYSRTQALLDGFAESLALADEVILAPIYAAREEPVQGVSSERIAEKMLQNGFSNVTCVPDKAALAAELAARAKEGEMYLFLGAGDIRESAEEMAQMLGERDGR